MTSNLHATGCDRLFSLVLLLPTLLALAGCGSKQAELTDADRILAAETGIDLHILQEIKDMGSVPVRMEGIDADYESVLANGITFEVHQDKARRVIAELRNKTEASGVLIFLQEVHFGYEPDRIGILRSTDKYDILRVRRTNGINYDLSDEDVINKIHEWDALYQLDFVGADFDWFEATFGTPPEDFTAFAREVYAVCPDIVDQGAGSVEELAKEIERTNSVYLWWD
jgi:hypothetical protein